MRKWKISEAKAKFSEMLSACEKFPQMICKRDKAIGVIIPVSLFEELMELKQRHQKPSMAELLKELMTIKESEWTDIEIPPRQDRPNSFGIDINELAL